MEKITLNVIYYGDLDDKNSNIKREDGSCLTTINISAQATIADFLDVFFQQTGVKRKHTFWDDGVKWYEIIENLDNENNDCNDEITSNREEVEIPYPCQINDTIIDESNENEFLSDWNISNNSNVTVVVGAFAVD